MRTLILASKSPRRKAILESMGQVFETLNTGVATPGWREDDERRLDGEPPSQYVLRTAREKARKAALLLQSQGRKDCLVLASDTIVVSHRQILGKPRDLREELRFLCMLEGRGHTVRTAVVALDTATGKERSAVSVSRVYFAPMTPEEKLHYATGSEPYDKAGGYAVQGYAARFIERIEGSYSGIMGLPVFETSRLLRRMGWEV